MAIIVNGKDIELMLNGKPVKQVLYNGKTIYPSKGRCSFICNDNNSNPEIPTSGDISWIKGRRCLAKPYQGGVAICYLDEDNSELFYDGTPAALDGSMGIWMTDIPSYWLEHKGEEYDINSIQNLNHPITLIHKDKDDATNDVTWNKTDENKVFSRRVLVGVTEAVRQNKVIISKKGVKSTGSLKASQYHNLATALGNGFDIIDYETHCKIAHLFYAKYGNRNPQGMEQFGTGENSYTRTIGTTSSLGNNDGKTSTQISFLGIEDFYGGKNEWMGGISSNGSTYYIYDGFEQNAVPIASHRIVDIGGSSREGYISKMYWGKHGDIIPIKVDASSVKHYCDYGLVADPNWHIGRRSGSSATGQCGVAYFHTYYNSEDLDVVIGSRIQYRGKIQELSVEEFKKIPFTSILSNGVYIASNDGSLVKPDSWNTSNNSKAVGVAVISDKCSFIIDKNNQTSNDQKWSNQLKDLSLTNYTSESQAKTDYNGEHNTDIIMSEDTQNVAAKYCRSKSITFGTTRNGYLGAGGEWWTIYNNWDTISSALSKISGAALNVYEWTSMERTYGRAWILYKNYGYLNDNSKDGAGAAIRPLYSL